MNLDKAPCCSWFHFIYLFGGNLTGNREGAIACQDARGPVRWFTQKVPKGFESVIEIDYCLR